MFYKGISYYNIGFLPKIKFLIDDSEGKLYLKIPSLFFLNTSKSIFNDKENVKKKYQENWGAYLNYNIFFDKTHNNRIYSNMLLSLHTFGQLGRLQNDILIKNNHVGNQILRLTTTWKEGIPDKLQSFKIGDIITDGGIWGSSVSYGGFQWSRNFSEQPYLNTLPLPSAHGVAKRPSIADIYSNNIFQKQVNLPPGPFDINNIPVINGAGNINIVIRNPLGGESIINVPYYKNSQLLKEGLSDFTLSVGLLRQNYGFQSNNYRHWITSGTYYYGLNNLLTTGLHFEITHKIQALGVSSSSTIFHYFTFTTAAALSHKNKYGSLIEIDLNRATKNYNIGFNYKFTTPYFSLVGSSDNEKIPEDEIETHFSTQIIKNLSVGVGYLYQHYRIGKNINNKDALTFNSSLYISKSLFLTGSILYSFDRKRQYTVLASLIFQLDRNKTVTANITKIKNSAQSTIGFEKNSAFKSGFGYSFISDLNKNMNSRVNLNYHNNISGYSLDLIKNNNQLDYQAEIMGAFSFLKNQIYFTKTISNSFGVIHTPGLQNVPIYRENRLVGKTNGGGYIIIPNLIPYTNNSISIHPDQIPLDIKIKKEKITVIPQEEAGVYIDFPIYKTKQATLKIKLKSGEFVPTGATVILEKSYQTTLVADGGVVYFSSLADINSIIVKWKKMYVLLDYCILKKLKQ